FFQAEDGIPDGHVTGVQKYALPISSKRAALVPEELAFEKIFGNRGAIDRHKGAVLTRTEVMNQTGEEFLACAAFAEEKHGRRPGGHFLRFFLRLHQQRATTHEFRCPALQKLFLQKNIL